MKYNTRLKSHNRPIWTIFLFSLCLILFSHSAIARDFDLAWDASSAPDVVGYRVYYQTDSATLPLSGTDAIEGDSPIDVGANTSAEISGLSDAGIHYFAVTAYTADGRESSFSNVVASDWVPVPITPDQNTSDISVSTSLRWSSPPDGRDVVYTVYLGTDPTLTDNQQLAQNLPLRGGLPAMLAGVFVWGWRRKSTRSRLQPWLFALLAAALIMLPACGGGGGSSDDGTTVTDTSSNTTDNNTSDMSGETPLPPTDTTTQAYTLVFDDLMDNTLDVADLAPDTRYYWKVVAWDGVNETESVIYSFETSN